MNAETETTSKNRKASQIQSSEIEQNLKDIATFKMFSIIIIHI
jgi:hypothetical protein